MDCLYGKRSRSHFISHAVDHQSCQRFCCILNIIAPVQNTLIHTWKEKNRILGLDISISSDGDCNDDGDDDDDDDYDDDKNNNYYLLYQTFNGHFQIVMHGLIQP